MRSLSGLTDQELERECESLLATREAACNALRSIDDERKKRAERFILDELDFRDVEMLRDALSAAWDGAVTPPGWDFKRKLDLVQRLDELLDADPPCSGLSGSTNCLMHPPCSGPGYAHAPHGRCPGYSTDRT